MTLALGLAGFVLVGLALGMLGGGGSILANPVLVYVLAIPAGTAAPMALPVVGITAAAGAFVRWRMGHVRLRTGAVFAACSMLASYAAARLGVGIPDRSRLLLFGGVMVVASIMMWRRSMNMASDHHVKHHRAIEIVPVAILVGALTGILGVGGGFLIVPALAAVLELPMREAAATSLAVIALNSAAASAGFLTKHVTIDLQLTALVTVAALIGMAIGLRLAPKHSGATLARAFAVVVLVLGVFIIGKELVN